MRKCILIYVSITFFHQIIALGSNGTFYDTSPGPLKSNEGNFSYDLYDNNIFSFDYNTLNYTTFLNKTTDTLMDVYNITSFEETSTTSIMTGDQLISRNPRSKPNLKSKQKNFKRKKSINFSINSKNTFVLNKNLTFSKSNSKIWSINHLHESNDTSHSNISLIGIYNVQNISLLSKNKMKNSVPHSLYTKSQNPRLYKADNLSFVDDPILFKRIASKYTPVSKTLPFNHLKSYTGSSEIGVYQTKPHILYKITGNTMMNFLTTPTSPYFVSTSPTIIPSTHSYFISKSSVATENPTYLSDSPSTLNHHVPSFLRSSSYSVSQPSSRLYSLSSHPAYSPYAAVDTTENPGFDTATPTNVSAQLGGNVYLTCRVHNIGNRSISWIRTRDAHILTVNRYTFIADERFQSWHDEKTNTWTLQVKYVQARDDGRYECQISTEPKMSRFVYFKVVVPDVRISRGTDSQVIVNSGSTVDLQCIISGALHAPEYIFWYQGNERVVASSRGREVQIERRAPDTTIGTLTIRKVSGKDAGEYKCVPSSLQSATVRLHVENGENPAPMQHGTSMMTSPTSTATIISTFLSLILGWRIMPFQYYFYR